jgi:hypothetical protein
MRWQIGLPRVVTSRIVAILVFLKDIEYVGIVLAHCYLIAGIGSGTWFHEQAGCLSDGGRRVKLPEVDRVVGFGTANCNHSSEGS